MRVMYVNNNNMLSCLFYISSRRFGGMDDVYIVEIVSTGNAGMPKDTVAEVGVCRMFADGSDFDTVFDGRVALDPRDIGAGSLDHLSQTYGIQPEELYMGDDQSFVVEGFQKCVFGHECTSYDVNGTFGKYLCFEPWDATGELTLLPSYSIRLPRDIRTPPEGESAISYAYSRLCPDDPADVHGGRHAVDLAQMSASVMMVLRRNGLF